MSLTATAPKPRAPQPRVNPLHTSILHSMLTIGTTTRKELRTKKGRKITAVDNRGERYTLQTYVDFPVDIPVPTLAGNISEENVLRSADRWLR